MQDWDPIKPSQDKGVRWAAIGCLGGLGGFLLWAGLVPLAEGVPTHGHVVVDESRQVVQHLEGGLIRTLHVREGDAVTAGQPLVELADVAALAGRDQVVKEIAALTATVERLIALREGRAAPDFAALDALPLAAADRAEVIDNQTAFFEQQRSAHVAELDVLRTRMASAEELSRSRGEQIPHAERRLQALRERLANARTMFAQELMRRDAVAMLEQEEAALQADIVRLRAERDEQASMARDYSGQIAQAEARFQEELSQALVQARTDLFAAQERFNAAQDVLDRAVILAPRAGEVLNLKFTTEGGVVRPGEPILEIVPMDGAVTALVRVRPTDRSLIYEGQRVRTRLLAYRSWRAPRFEGEITQVSADLKTDPATGASYYEARIAISDPELDGVEVEAGMPVEAFVFSGARRTTLDYLIEPLGEAFFRGVRGA